MRIQKNTNFNPSLSNEGMDLFSKLLKPNSSIIDIGSGEHEGHSNLLRLRNHLVDTCDFHEKATYSGDFVDLDINKKYDACWCSHVLEHQKNVNSFLTKITKVVKPNGLICITVPPLKHEIVGGHLTLWNAGLLIYNLIMARIDCSYCKIKKYNYNISIIFHNTSRPSLELCTGGPDLNKLHPFFPKGLQWKKNAKGNLSFCGDISELNWNEN
jgi:SAM-dependent methyltransferase